MKKIISILCILTIILSSCSGDDSASQSNVVLLTKMIQTFESGNPIETTYQYNGNRLTKIFYGNLAYAEVTYSGNLITKIQQFQNNELIQEIRYEYENNKLVNFKRFEYDDNYGTNIDYTYNADGTVAFEKFSGSLSSPLAPSVTGVFVLNSSGEVISAQYFNGYLQTYTYDTKNSPFKNVLGMDKLAFDDDSANGFIHNLILEEDLYYSTTTTYTYNSGNYPLTSSEDDGDEVINTQYFYNN